MDIFAQRLKELREEKHLNYVDLSKELNVSYTTISRWENQLRVPNIIELKKIAQYFNVSADYLLGLQEF
ncbi:MAG: helix-turn-helix transcriptional regulator [Clostridia bacterium]|nr:helix-turn-helix transcriptional regulator [Clostridia bacterium]